MTNDTLLVDLPECAVSAHESVMFVHFRENATGKTLRALRTASQKFAATRPNGIIHVNLVKPVESSTAVPEDVRDELLALLRDPTMALRASAVVYPGGGFVGAMIRSLLAGLVLLAKTPTAVRVFGDLTECEAWIQAMGVKHRVRVPPNGEVVRRMNALCGIEPAPLKMAR